MQYAGDIPMKAFIFSGTKDEIFVFPFETMAFPNFGFRTCPMTKTAKSQSKQTDYRNFQLHIGKNKERTMGISDPQQKMLIYCSEFVLVFDHLLLDLLGIHYDWP